MQLYINYIQLYVLQVTIYIYIYYTKLKSAKICFYIYYVLEEKKACMADDYKTNYDLIIGNVRKCCIK